MSWIWVEGALPGAEVVEMVEVEGGRGSWEVGCWEGKAEVGWVSSVVVGWVVDWLSVMVVVWVSDVEVVVEPGRGGPRRSMPADSRGWRDSSSFGGVSDWLTERRGIEEEWNVQIEARRIVAMFHLWARLVVGDI